MICPLTVNRYFFFVLLISFIMNFPWSCLLVRKYSEALQLSSQKWHDWSHQVYTVPESLVFLFLNSLQLRQWHLIFILMYAKLLLSGDIKTSSNQRCHFSLALAHDKAIYKWYINLHQGWLVSEGLKNALLWVIASCFCVQRDEDQGPSYKICQNLSSC